jgi:hypothetical protein
MSWKFWKKPVTQNVPSAGEFVVPAIQWNTDAYDSMKFLFGMYVRDVPPFSLWRDSDAQLLPSLEELASTNAKAYQLWFWFAGYQQRRGTIEAVMLPEAFFHLFETSAPDTDLSDQIRWLFDFQEKGLLAFEETPPDKKGAVDAAMGAEMPPEYYLAMYQLLGFPDSPYRDGKTELPEEQQRALSLCLLNARMVALKVFTPMLDAIITFDPARITSWRWSEPLGAHERHLQRRHDNPLFPPGRRRVTATDVFRARLLDAKAHVDAFDELEAIRKELRETELPRDWFSYLNAKREQIEDLQDRIWCMDQRGDDLKPMGERLRAFVVGTMLDTMKGHNAEGAAAIEEAEVLHAQRQAFFSSNFLRQLINRAPVIPPDEIVPALLCENESSLRVIVNGMEHDQALHESLAHARTGALDIVRAARATGAALPEIEHKLQILGVAL